MAVSSYKWWSYLKALNHFRWHIFKKEAITINLGNSSDIYVRIYVTFIFFIFFIYLFLFGYIRWSLLHFAHFKYNHTITTTDYGLQMLRCLFTVWIARKRNPQNAQIITPVSGIWMVRPFHYQTRNCKIIRLLVKLMAYFDK